MPAVCGDTIKISKKGSYRARVYTPQICGGGRDKQSFVGLSLAVVVCDIMLTTLDANHEEWVKTVFGPSLAGSVSQRQPRLTVRPNCLGIVSCVSQALPGPAVWESSEASDDLRCLTSKKNWSPTVASASQPRISYAVYFDGGGITSKEPPHAVLSADPCVKTTLSPLPLKTVIVPTPRATCCRKRNHD